MDQPSGWPVVVGLGVRVVERVAQLEQDADGDVDRRRPGDLARVAEDPADVAAVDVLHRDEVLGADAAELEDLDDVDVVEQRGELRLADERLDEARVLGEVRQQALERDHALEAFDAALERAMDRRHTADAEALVDEVRAELLFFGGVGAHSLGIWSVARTVAHRRQSREVTDGYPCRYRASSGVLTSSVRAWIGPFSSSASAAITSRWRWISDLPANAADTIVAFQWSSVPVRSSQLDLGVGKRRADLGDDRVGLHAISPSSRPTARERRDRLIDVGLGVRRRQLDADARLALGDDREREADDVDAVLEQPRAPSRPRAWRRRASPA